MDYTYLPSTAMRAIMNYEKFQTIDGGYTKPEEVEAMSLGIQGRADAKVHDDASTSISFDSAWDQAIANDGEVDRMPNQHVEDPPNRSGNSKGFQTVRRGGKTGKVFFRLNISLICQSWTP